MDREVPVDDGRHRDADDERGRSRAPGQPTETGKFFYPANLLKNGLEKTVDICAHLGYSILTKTSRVRRDLTVFRLLTSQPRRRRNELYTRNPGLGCARTSI